MSRTVSIARAPLDSFLLAEAFLSANQSLHLRHHQERWYGWTGTHYQEIAESDLRAAIALVARDRATAAATHRTPAPLVTRAVVSNALQALAALTLVPAGVELPAWLAKDSRGEVLAMENGLVSVDRLLRNAPATLSDHSPEWFSTTVLPYSYVPGATAPRWEAFLVEIFAGDPSLIAVAQELFGYLLLPDNSMQRFFILTGEGANGKSVLLDVLTQLLGENNVSHVPLELFGQRFQLHSTLHKSANICTEIGEIDRIAEGLLKAFTSGDRMHFEEKGKNPIAARPTARLVFSTNQLPQFRDRSSGIWRRMTLIPCDVVIPPERQDPRLGEKLKEELPGIFLWAVEGLRRLRARGAFTRARAADAAKEEYRLESNPARAFLTEVLVESAGAVLPCQTLYDRYRRWCDERGVPPLAAPQFGKEVRRAFPLSAHRQARDGGNVVGVYRGLAFAASD
jgi:P4 family phage/plasmid primase-like protien